MSAENYAAAGRRQHFYFDSVVQYPMSLPDSVSARLKEEYDE